MRLEVIDWDLKRDLKHICIRRTSGGTTET